MAEKRNASAQSLNDATFDGDSDVGNGKLILPRVSAPSDSHDDDSHDDDSREDEDDDRACERAERIQPLAAVPGDHCGVRVLIVEDEVALAEGLRDGLTAEGHEVFLAHDGDTGFTLASRPDLDVVILDIMLPMRNGYRVCRDLRADGVQTPILMLTAKDGELDEAEALDTGADDFLSKPFSFVVLEARIRALGRRGSGTVAPAHGERLVCGDLTLDLGGRRCHRNGTEVSLTSRELDLLAEVMRAAPNVVAKQDLLTRVWGGAFEGDPNVVEVYVGYLRRKIDVPFGRATLQTVRGHGYRLDSNA
jgi:two-component system, OmpR family, response regulator